MNVAPEVNLLRWFNFHLRRANHPRTVNNFTTDISVPFPLLSYFNFFFAEE